MLKHWCRALGVAALALVVLTPIYATLTSPDFANCQQHQGQYPTAENERNKSAPVLVPVPSAIRITWTCIGGYTNANGSAITAIATVLLTIVTGLLVWVARQQFVTTRAQLRAYVFQEGASVLDGSNLKGKTAVDRTNQPGITSTIKNFGQTPAYDVIHWIQLDVLEVYREESLIAPVPSRNVTHNKIYLAPSGTSPNWRWLNRALSDQEMKGILDGTWAIYLCGRVDYRDAFGQPHFTTYRLKYTGSIYPPIAEGGGSFNFCNNGNDSN